MLKPSYAADKPFDLAEGHKDWWEDYSIINYSYDAHPRVNPELAYKLDVTDPEAEALQQRLVDAGARCYLFEDSCNTWLMPDEDLHDQRDALLSAFVVMGFIPPWELCLHAPTFATAEEKAARIESLEQMAKFANDILKKTLDAKTR